MTTFFIEDTDGNQVAVSAAQLRCLAGLHEPTPRHPMENVLANHQYEVCRHCRCLYVEKA